MKATKKWIPKVGDHIFHVAEFMLDDYRSRTMFPGYHRYGFEIVESVVTSPYCWKSAGAGVRSVSDKRDVGSNPNNVFFWRPRDYGVTVFRTFEDAIPLAEEKTRYYEQHCKLKSENEPMYRQWEERQEDGKR